jgi:anthranilate synthase component 2
VQYLWDEGAKLVVFKNDEKTCDEIAALNPRGVLISPGPGAPEDSGIALQACRELGPRFPLFGVCMGHQCIGQTFGGRVVRAPTGLMHGKQSPVFHDASDEGGLLEGMARRVPPAQLLAHCPQVALFSVSASLF